MNRLDIIIIIVVSTIFLLAVYKLYQDGKKSKLGLGCAGCRIAETCQKPENLKRIKTN